MRIDHYSLELFISVAEMGSITRAASLNRIAASALSRRLTDLEAVIGMPLLIRSAAGVEMTEAGRHALLFAKNVDEQFQQMTREIQTLSRQVAGVVRLFANASAIVGFLPEILKSFQASFPSFTSRLLNRSATKSSAHASTVEQTSVSPLIAIHRLIFKLGILHRIR